MSAFTYELVQLIKEKGDMKEEGNFLEERELKGKQEDLKKN